MSITDQLIDDIIVREGHQTNDPVDPGGLTYKGLSKRANPDLFVNGLPTDQQVHQRYVDRYVKGPGFDKVADPSVESLLVDWGVNSGPAIAIMALQRIVGAGADGLLGPATLAATNAYPADKLIGKLVAERVRMIGRIVSKNPSQLRYINGWLSRSLEWL